MVSLNGIMTAARTLSFYTRMSEVVQNNLANQSTDGFKFDRIIAAFDPGTGAPVLHRSIDMKQGQFTRTHRPTDLALQGPGFFVVRTPAGERLTRNGAFSLNEDRVLVDDANRPVLGKDGPITIQGDDIEVTSNGTIFADGKELDRLRIVNVAKPEQLQKEGVSLFVSTQPFQTVSPDERNVRQFGLEESNVNGISGIGDMIQIQRNFALNMSAMRTMDEMLATLTNNVGRV